MAANTDSSAAAATLTQHAERLLQVVRALEQEMYPAHPAGVTLDSALEGELGFDSLTQVELVQRLNQAFGVQLPDEVLSHTETVRDLLPYLAQPGSVEATPAIMPLQQGSAIEPPRHAGTLVEALLWHVERQPERVHVLLYDEQQTLHPIRYRELFEAGRAIAGGLAARGVAPGETIALMLPTGLGYLASFIGIMLAGCVPVPIYPPTRLSQIDEHLRRHARILNNAAVVLMMTTQEAKPVATLLRADVPSLAGAVTPEDLAGETDNRPFPSKPSDLAFLQYTPGSTGDPKGVMLSHANLLANIRVMGQVIGITSEDVGVSWLPLYHDMGLIGAWLGSLYHGCPLVLLPTLSFLAQPARWLQAVSRHRATLSGAPNFAYELCSRKTPDSELQGLDLSHWRFAFNGAEPVSPATLEHFATRFAACGFQRTALTPVYGLAESTVALAFPPLGRGPRIDQIAPEPFVTSGQALPVQDDRAALRIPSCGRPLPNHEIRIIGEDGSELSERQVGRLEFRGPSATQGYYHNPTANAGLFHDGWLDSGDNAYMADGEVYLTGRIKDLIIRAGRNFYPYDLEEAIGNLPGIRKGCVAVFASADPRQGSERLVVLAETREQGSTAGEQLRQRIRQTAADVVGVPLDDIVLAPPHTVLKTSSGKIRRQACRTAYEQGKVNHPPTISPWRQSLRLWRESGYAWGVIAFRQFADWCYGVYAWAVLLTLALPAGALTILLRRPAMGRRLVHAAARLGLGLSGLKVRVQGLERLPSQPHVLLLNHASYLDVLLLTALLPAAPGYTFTAKRELSTNPLLRALLSGLGVCFIERADIRQSQHDIDAMVSALQAGENLLVFPEGTFTRAAGLRPFHLGGFLAAGQARVPVVVAGLRGTRIVLRDGTWLPRRAPIEFEVGPSEMPSGPDWAAAATLSQAMRPALVALSGEHDAA